MVAEKKVLALSGGVGGAKLALGLAKILPPGRLAVVCNTGDDFVHLGLKICPDLDTVMYTLADQSNREQGWGLEDESWQVMNRLGQLGGESWFNLGDKDLATHLLRTHLLNEGMSLSRVTETLCQAMKVGHQILPMSDDSVSTSVHTNHGTMSFQHYFVREQCKPAVRGFEFRGITDALPQEAFMAMLKEDSLSAVILCPSNPFVSIDPILHLRGIREALLDCSAPVIAVSPIVGGQAIKGPTAKMMSELKITCDCVSVARHYADFLDAYILDRVDEAHLDEVKKLGIYAVSTNTVMNDLADKTALAEYCLKLADRL